MIKIHQPVLTQENGRTRLSSVIETGQEQRTAYLELLGERPECLSAGISDGFVAAVLLLAMRRGEDIACEAPISERLLYQLTTFLMPFLAGINAELRPVQILAGTFGRVPSLGRVGTGISCGLDSLAAVRTETDPEKPCCSYKVDTLVYLNAGHYGTNEKAHAVWEQYSALPKRFAQTHNLDMLMVDSNFFEFMPYPPAQASFFAICGIILQMQSFFCVYHIGSSFRVFDFAADFQETGLYETFAMDALSTESLKLYSAGCLKNRSEKLETFIDDPEYMKYLYCCVASGGGEHNCSHCEKCVRTYLNAYALGKTENLRQTFDIDYMDAHRDYFLAYMLKMKRKRVFIGYFYRETYAQIRKNGLKIPKKAYLLALLPYHYDRYQIVATLRASIWYDCKSKVKRIIGRSK